MKHILTLIALATVFLASSQAVSEVTISCENKIVEKGFYDESGKKDSVWTIFDEDGNVSEQGEYVNGEKEGDWTYYYDNHKIFQVSYRNGKKRKGVQWDLQGRIVDKRTWSDDGKLICETLRFY